MYTIHRGLICAVCRSRFDPFRGGGYRVWGIDYCSGYCFNRAMAHPGGRPGESENIMTDQEIQQIEETYNTLARWQQNEREALASIIGNARSAIESTLADIGFAVAFEDGRFVIKEKGN